MEISHPRRVLILSTSPTPEGTQGTLNFIKSLTGSDLELSPDSSSLAGLSHTWSAKTQYYTAKVPVWVDEVPANPPASSDDGNATPDSVHPATGDNAITEDISSAPEQTATTPKATKPSRDTNLSTWQSQFLSPAAGEVVSAIAAWIVTFPKPTCKSDLDSAIAALRSVSRILAFHQSNSRSGSLGLMGEEPTLLAVATRQPSTPHHPLSVEEWDDLCRGAGGWEYIDAEAAGRNEYGEPVGMRRVKEALESTEWGGGGGAYDDDDFGLSDEEGKGFVDGERAFTDEQEEELNAELWEMKGSLLRGEDDRGEEADDGGVEGDGDERLQVEELEMAMRRLQAVKEMGEGMPDQQRKALAAKAVKDIMKDLDL